MGTKVFNYSVPTKYVDTLNVKDTYKWQLDPLP